MFISKAQRKAFVEASHLLRLELSESLNYSKFVACTGLVRTGDGEDAATTIHNSIRSRDCPIGLPDSPCVLVLLECDCVFMLALKDLQPGSVYANSYARVGRSSAHISWSSKGVLVPTPKTMSVFPDAVAAQDGMECARINVGTWIAAGLPGFDPQSAMKNGSRLSSSQFNRLHAESTIAACAMTALVMHSLPTGYIFRATAKNQGLKRDHRLFKPGQSALVHIPFDRLWTIYGESFRQTMQDAPEPHRRRGHIRHHWKEAGIDRRFDIPSNPAERAALAATVRRQWINPCWVGLPREGGDDWFDYALPKDVPLIDGPAAAKPETDAA